MTWPDVAALSLIVGFFSWMVYCDCRRPAGESTSIKDDPEWRYTERKEDPCDD